MEFNAQAWTAMAEAILIGLLVGIERESDREERHAGLRDFVTLGIAGGLCGLLAIPILTITALAAITGLLIVFRVQTPGRTGITTEIAAVVTFLLCVLTASTHLAWGSPLAIALTVVLVLFLEARESLRKFFREVVTEREFRDTVRFLAVIFVIYPVLPDGGFGPYEFFNPSRLWLFVILVSSISFLGYFLEKFLGQKHGLLLTGVLGGIASTTAATISFARQSEDSPESTSALARAAIVANAVQAPRVFAILLFAAPAVGWAAAPVLAGMFAAGLLVSWLYRDSGFSGPGNLALRNPFSLLPALKFGALFALVRLIARASSAEFGSAGVMWAAFLGGSIDVDAIAFSVSGLVRDQTLPAAGAVLAVLIALASNAVLKTVLAFAGGGPRFARPVLFAFLAMLATGGAILLLLNRV